VKVIGLVPVRNEAWVLEHSLASLSGFCDVIIVSDQHSSDDSRDICRRFPRVVLLDPEATDMAGRLPQKARWRLLDAARSYDGDNVLWCTDADELTPPAAVRSFFSHQAGRLVPGVAIACRYYHLWGSTARFRDDLSIYGPQFTNSGFTLKIPVTLAPGGYTVATFAHNALTQQFDAVATAHVTITPAVSNGLMNIDTPTAGATLTSAFEVGGWAIDMGAPTGTGVDAVRFFVFPNDGAAPVPWAPRRFVYFGGYSAIVPISLSQSGTVTLRFQRCISRGS